MIKSVGKVNLSDLIYLIDNRLCMTVERAIECSISICSRSGEYLQSQDTFTQDVTEEVMEDEVPTWNDGKKERFDSENSCLEIKDWTWIVYWESLMQ